MKKHNSKVSAGKRFTHFMRHYFGYLVVALVCAIATVLLVGVCGF